MTSGLKNIDYEGSACKMNLVLNKIPQFTSLAEVNARAATARTMRERCDLYKKYLAGTIHVNQESMQDIHTAYVDALNGKVCKRPMVEMFLPQILD